MDDKHTMKVSDLEHNILKNITDIDVNAFGITHDGVRDFIEKYLKNLNQSYNRVDKTITEQPHAASCAEGYCQGDMTDFFASYKNLHGYIALVVSYDFLNVLINLFYLKNVYINFIILSIN